MIFYLIKLFSVPKIKFAHHVELETYKNSFNRIPDSIELAFIEKGAITMEFEDRTEKIEERSISPILSDMKCRTSCAGKQIHNTVGVKVNYALERFDSECLTEEDYTKVTESVKESNALLIPYNYRFDDKASYDYAVNAIKSIMRNHISSSNELLCVSKWFEIADFLTKTTLRELASERFTLSPMACRYTEIIKNYIGENITKQIKISDISKRAGISVNYAQKIFKTATGKTIIEYANQKKTEAALQFMMKNNTTAAKAAESVGFSDSLYFCRLVKKYFGVSVTEYKKLKRE